MSELTLDAVVACPGDGGPLEAADAGYRCDRCGAFYSRGPHGYFELFAPGDPSLALETTAGHPATGRERGEARLYSAYLREWLAGFGATRILDAGCGAGLGVAAMLSDRLDAFGIDLPAASLDWREQHHDTDRYACGNVTRLPFHDDTFDAVVSIGVIEHIGTTTGHITVGPDCDAQRARFAAELLRVTRPGGRVLLSCPNKRFPVDVQHGPRDAETLAPLRTWLFDRTGLNVHPIAGRYHLASYRDIARWFRDHEWRALPLEGFFGFSAFQRGDSLFARTARRYVHALPSTLRRTALNPYVLVEVTA